MGLKETFTALADSMMTSVFSDFTGRCVYVDTSSSLEVDYNPETGERQNNDSAYKITNARIFGYTDREKAKNQNIAEIDVKCSFRVNELSKMSVEVKSSGLIIDSKLAIYSIENIYSNGIMYSLRIRMQQVPGSGTQYSHLFY